MSSSRRCIRRSRRRVRVLPLLLATVASSGCATDRLAGHSTTEIAFASSGDELRGALTLPFDHPAPAPALIFVAGDGPVDRDAHGCYRAFREALAARGIASFSWDKPGVGGSTGDWLAQDMDERAAEVIAAYRRLDAHEGVDAERIGVLGQGAYFRRKRLERARGSGARGEPMSEARFGFVKGLIDENATRNLADIDVPVLALFGGQDLNVDVHDSIEVYSRVFAGNDRVGFEYRLFPDATHQLTESGHVNEQIPGFRAWLMIQLLGDALFADGVLDAVADFASEHGGPSADGAGRSVRMDP